MFFQIDLADGKPVYLQMIDQVKQAIARGSLKAGDRLPAIRDVAVQARVNRNTVARVYAELEREGLLISRAGQGSFVSDRGTTITAEERLRRFSTALDEALTQARLDGLSRDEVGEIFQARLNLVLPADRTTQVEEGAEE